jgi:hypothetical protein
MAFSTKCFAFLTLPKAALRQPAAAPLVSASDRSCSAELSSSIALRKRPSQPNPRSMGGWSLGFFPSSMAARLASPMARSISYTAAC